jgi:hypothetical protein
LEKSGVHITEKSAVKSNELGTNVVEISSPTDADKVFGNMNRMTSNITKHSAQIQTSANARKEGNGLEYEASMRQQS